MDDEFDDFDGVEPLPSSRARLIDLILLPFCFLQLVFEAAALTLDSLVRILAGHANYMRDQSDFADEVRAELESIPSTED